MTRDEAISIFAERLSVSERYKDEEGVEEYREAMRIAIEALQQPEIVRCKDCKRNVDNGGVYPDGRTNFAILQKGKPMNDLISRQATIDAITSAIWHFPNECYRNLNAYEFAKAPAELGLQSVPAVQTEKRTNKRTETHECDLISRQATIDINEEYHGRMPNETNFEIYKKLKQLPSAQPEQRWIPCSERLPEEDKEVLISYRYKEGEGDISHVEIDITTYGQMYFGGNKVGHYKHWRAPFEYFESNYEVIAWMPLPESYRGDEDGK